MLKKDLTEDQDIKNYAKQGMRCIRSTTSPYEYELNYAACGYNVMKQENELCKNQRTEINFIIFFKYAEKIGLVIC